MYETIATSGTSDQQVPIGSILKSARVSQEPSARHAENRIAGLLGIHRQQPLARTRPRQRAAEL